MRSRFAQIAFPTLCLAVLWFWSTPATSVESSGGPCPAPKGHFVGGLKISHINFSGANNLPLAVQEQIAHSIERQVYAPSLEAVADPAVELARVNWQNRGYSKVTVSSTGATLNAFPPQTVALTIHVVEGPRYRLGQISFINNKAVNDINRLRSLFPIRDGEVFSREKIAAGLENLRNMYTTIGYINFTSIPDISFDEPNKLVFLSVDVDEGTQFYLRSMDIVGVDKTTREDLLRDAPFVGSIYNSQDLRVFIQRHPAVFRFAADDPARLLRRLDEHAGTVDITIDARLCGL